MSDLFRAEWSKIAGHRQAMLGLLGIFPIGAVIFFLFSSLAASKPAMVQIIESSLSNWTDLMLLAWLIPSNFFGRLFLLAFTALTFAGEYQWGTWKNLTPRRSRGRLVLIKFVTMSLLVALDVFLLSLLLAAGGTGLATMAGVAVEPAFDLAQIRSFAADYALAATLAFLAFLITGTFAALGAIATRTILGGTLTGMVSVFLDPALMHASSMLARTFEIPGILQIQRLVPFYNIENVRSWLTSQQASSMLDQRFAALDLAPPADGVAFSLTVLLVWVVAGISATVVAFRRQDITT